jgi:ParB family chromosome partitioning protein
MAPKVKAKVAPPPQRQALGRGLSALLPSAAAPAPVARAFTSVAISEVSPEREQPRRYWDTARIDELSASIKQRGVIQPILVRRVPDGYRIVAGERRWRAAQQAGLTEIPVIVKDVSESEAFEIALVENIQREDLNPIEEAEAYQRLLGEFGLKQEEVAARVGKERSTITNALRLLKLPQQLREHVAAGALSVGHAKVLLGVDDSQAMGTLALQVTARGLSVRDTEKLVERWKSPTPRAKKAIPSELKSLAKRMERAIGMRCVVEMKSADTGAFAIRFSSLAQAQQLIEALVADLEKDSKS